MKYPYYRFNRGNSKKQDIEEVFRRHLETTINQLLKQELTVFG